MTPVVALTLPTLHCMGASLKGDIGLFQITEDLPPAHMHNAAEISGLGAVRADTEVPLVFNDLKGSQLGQGTDVVVVDEIGKLIHGHTPPQGCFLHCITEIGCGTRGTLPFRGFRRKGQGNGQPPSPQSARMRPPMASVRCLAMVSPSPVAWRPDSTV